MLDPVTFAIGIYALGATVIAVRQYSALDTARSDGKSKDRELDVDAKLIADLNYQITDLERALSVEVMAVDSKRRNAELELLAERARVSVLEAQLKALKDKAGERTRKGNLTRYARRRAAMEAAA